MKKLFIILACILMASCATNTKTPPLDDSLSIDFMEESNEPTVHDSQSNLDEEMESHEKIFQFKNRGLKIEMEEFDFVDCRITEDERASKQKSLAFTKDSKAWTKITLPEGKFEILFSQKAFSTSGSHLKVTIENPIPGENNFGNHESQKKIYHTYPSEPPLGCFELTIRKPIVVKNESPCTIMVTVESDEWETKKSMDFFVDYMQIVLVD